MTLNEPIVPLAELLTSLPPLQDLDALALCQIARDDVQRKVIALDDDPTGTQTVHDIAVITEWSVDSLCRELLDPSPALFILTNSRSFPRDQADAIHREIGAHLKRAKEQTGIDFVVISRSDSTLRGHFPSEVEALAQSLEQPVDGWVVAPFFEAGGRLTIHDVHYVLEGNNLVPAAQTPFARDSVFGYQHSNLREWIVEKTAGLTALSDIVSVGLGDIRTGGPDRVAEIVREMPKGGMAIINAVVEDDMRVAVTGLLQLEKLGSRYVYRTAASFVSARAGIGPRPLLSREELHHDQGVGRLVLVGSHVPKSTSQLSYLLDHADVHAIEINVPQMLEADDDARIISELITQVSDALEKDQTVVVSTSRDVVTGSEDVETLSIGQRVSQWLVNIVQGLRVAPRHLVAKGGITSSDIATHGCGIRRALVMGQILPGIPVWQCGSTSRFPGMPLIVFPGNVGSEQALAEVVDKLSD